MPGRSDRTAHSWLAKLAALAILALGAPAFSQQSVTTAIKEAEVHEAVEILKKDPDLATTRQMRTLRWIDDEEEQKRKKPGWLKWIADLFGWFAEVSRVFVWLLIALLIGLLVLYLIRFTRTFDKRGAARNRDAPTHVRDLDIRPESLPDNIGAEAWGLWDRGEHRAGLSLLYRGLLSRLAHVHQVPVRHSSTEGDCLSLARRYLPADRHEYISSLIATWQRAVYGGEHPQNDSMRALCDQFDAAVRPREPIGEGTA